jgi:hypothetical protein
MKKNRFLLLAVMAFSIALSLSSVPVFSAQAEKERDLPGYYEFFTKTGKLTRLKSEAKRDDEIKAGKITPVAVNQPVIDLKFPDGFSNVYGTRNYVDKKNLVLITGRAWW